MELKPKILIVEDERRIANFMSTVLTANHYDVITTASGREACSMISSHCPDLIILDLGLPDMDGQEIVRAVRSWTQMPIVVVSARTHERDKVEALDAGADDYVTKPFGTNELLARIRTALPTPAPGHREAARRPEGASPPGTWPLIMTGGRCSRTGRRSI